MPATRKQFLQQSALALMSIFLPFKNVLQSFSGEDSKNISAQQLAIYRAQRDIRGCMRSILKKKVELYSKHLK